MPEFYRQEDVQQILHLAIARQAQSGELTRAQLLEIATELNISLSDLQAAEQEWISRRGESEERETYNQLQRSRFNQSLFKYLVINAFLLVLNFMTAGTLSWSLIVAMAWGVPIALEGWRAYQTVGEEYEEAFQRWRTRRKLKRSVSTLLSRWLSV